jgi:hypothetical protein
MSARQKLTEIASYVQKRPSAATDIAGQITAALKSVFPTKAVVTHGQVINVGGHTYALTIVNGVVTAIVYT